MTKLSRPKRAEEALTAKKVEDSKISQVALHLEYLFDYGANLVDRVILLTESIEYPMFQHFDAALSEMERISKKRITIRINSPGGSVDEALAIVGRIKSSKCNIITEVYGAAFSAASLIAACGDVRKMSKFATIMHHEAQYGLYQSGHSFNKAVVEQMDRDEHRWAHWMADFSTQDKDFWLEFGKHTDKFLTPEQCLDLGIIDEII